MGCKDIQALFSEYFDGDGENIAGVPREEIAAHLRECPDCAAEYESFSQLMKEVQLLPEPGLPPRFHEGLMEHVRNTVKKEARLKKRKQFAFYRRIAATAVAASLLLVVFWMSGIFDFGTGVAYFERTAQSVPQIAAPAAEQPPPVTMDAPPIAAAGAADGDWSTDIVPIVPFGFGSAMGEIGDFDVDETREEALTEFRTARQIDNNLTWTAADGLEFDFLMPSPGEVSSPPSLIPVFIIGGAIILGAGLFAVIKLKRR